MKQEPIEIAMAAKGTQRRPLEPRTQKSPFAGSTAEPRVVDEAFARFDEATCSPARLEQRDTRMLKQALVADLAAQLKAFDHQRERLAMLMKSIESNSIAH